MASPKKVTLLLKRGLKKDLPTLAPGEAGFATDTKEFFVGSETGNIPLASTDQVQFVEDKVTGVETTLGNKADKSYVDTELGKKANASSLGNKADKTYVDTELGKKADTTALSNKADKTEVTTLTAQLAEKVKKVNTLLYITDFEKYKVGNDWAEAIQQAVNSIPNGGTIIFPKGTYQTTKQMPYVSNLVLKGEGYNKTIIQYIGTQSITSFIDVTSNGLTLEDIRIMGNATSDITQTCHGVYMHTLSGQTGGHYFRNVYIDNFGGHGFYLGANVFMCIFESIRLYDNKRNGMYIDGTDCTFSNIHTQGNKQHGIELVGGNHRLSNVNCIFNGENGSNYAGFYQSAWNCQLSNIQCQDNYYSGIVFDGAKNTTLSSVSSDASGRAYGRGQSTLNSYEFVFKNGCKNINGNIQALNYIQVASTISGLYVDSTCFNLNIKYEEVEGYFANSPQILSDLVKIDSSINHLYDKFIKSGKTLVNKMNTPDFSATGGYGVFSGTPARANNILTVTATTNTCRVQIYDTKTTDKLYYVGVKVKAPLGKVFTSSIFKDDNIAPAYHSVGGVSKSFVGTGDWQYISFLYFLKNAESQAYYPTIALKEANMVMDFKEAITIDMTTDLGILFSANFTSMVHSLQFMDKLIQKTGWFSTSYVLT